MQVSYSIYKSFYVFSRTIKTEGCSFDQACLSDFLSVFSDISGGRPFS